MAGKWVKRKIEDHICYRPSYTSEVRIGDVWACDCGESYTVARIEHGMQWDPIVPPVLRWERV